MSRNTYLRYLAICAVASFVAFMLIGATVSFVRSGIDVHTIRTLMYVLPAMVLALCTPLIIRRSHDLGWIGAPFIALFALLIFSELIASWGIPRLILLVPGLVGIGGGFVLLIKKGQPEANRFGPPPVA